jgi:signal transduction histidine kinase
LRHGKARQIKVSLACKHGSVRLEIADDGAGFDPKAAAGQGIGLRSMARRAAEAGGKLEVQSGLGRGTRVIVQIETKRS